MLITSYADYVLYASLNQSYDDPYGGDSYADVPLYTPIVQSLFSLDIWLAYHQIRL